MREYKCLHINEFTNGNYTLIPIRYEDRYEIMRWRNDQLNILRQNAPLTKEQQDNYFNNTINALFVQEHPGQILWSFLENGKLIGYGGFVHINWEKKSAEISFLTDTLRNKDVSQFISDWKNYLSLLTSIAKEQLHFNCIYTLAYDLRPYLYTALETSGFKETERFKNAVEIDGSKKDIVIHTFYSSGLNMRYAKKEDADLYFKWANDKLVRQNSYQTNEISYEEHVSWFNKKLTSGTCYFFLFETADHIPVGQVRIDTSKEETVIGVSIDEAFRGRGYGAEMIERASIAYLNKHPKETIIAYIKNENSASLKQFEKAGFIDMQEVVIANQSSYRLTKTRHERN